MDSKLHMAEELLREWLLSRGWTDDAEAGCWRHPRHGEHWSVLRAAAAEQEG